MIAKARIKLENLRFKDLRITKIRDKTLSLFLLSHHLFWYQISSYRTLLQKGALIISIDIDVGDKRVGELNLGRNDRNVNFFLSEYEVGKFEEAAVPMLARFFEEITVPVTFAVRGQLLEVDSTLLNSLLDSSVNHDIAAHGFYHREFNKLSISEAEKELELFSQKMKPFGIAAKAFVFPRNSVAHLELLEKHGYICYRGKGGLEQDGMYIVRQGKLYDVHPSLFINRNTSVRLLKKMLDLSISKRAPFHLWFHPMDFGRSKSDTKKNIRRVLYPFLSYAKTKEKSGLLVFETMSSIAKQLPRSIDNRGLL